MSEHLSTKPTATAVPANLAAHMDAMDEALGLHGTPRQFVANGNLEFQGRDIGPTRFRFSGLTGPAKEEAAEAKPIGPGKMTDFHYEYCLDQETARAFHLLNMTDRREIQRLSLRRKVQRKRMRRAEDRMTRAIISAAVPEIFWELNKETRKA